MTVISTDYRLCSDAAFTSQWKCTFQRVKHGSERIMEDQCTDVFLQISRFFISDILSLSLSLSLSRG